MERKKIKIGLFGFGVVGKGLYDVLASNPGLRAEIIKICVRDKGKERPIAKEHFTFYKHELLFNEEVNVIVELIDDAEAAFEIVKTALENGKAVVSANKKMIAEHLDELIALQKIHNVPFLYEAACCASIPVIRNLEEYYDNDLLQSLSGIINGSTNYILTKMSRDKVAFDLALREAQEFGYAESNPFLDIEGLDAKNKLTILLAHAFGIVANPGDIFHKGISGIGSLESSYALEKGYKIKLVAHAQKLNESEVAAFVLPQFVRPDSRLFDVDDVFNGVEIEGCFADRQFFCGRGAGSYPTASAVLSDISALSYDYRYEYKKLHQINSLKLSEDFSLQVFVRFEYGNSDITESFTEIMEHYQNGNACYIAGRIKFSDLVNAAWSRQENVSLVLCPDISLKSADVISEDYRVEELV